MRRPVAKSAVAVMAAVVVVLILQTPAVLGQPERPRDGQGEPGQRPRFPPERPGREPPGGGPWNNDVLVYRVSLNAEVIQIATFERAGVPTIARMKDGLNFTRVADVQIDGHRRWLGNAQSDGKVITCFGTGDPGESGFPVAGRPRGGVWMGVSNDGQDFRLVQTPPIPVADPGAVALPEGGWIVVGTGPPVRGRPGAEGRPAFGEPPPGPPGQPRGEPLSARGQIRVEKIDSKYKVASGTKPGVFVTGQEADLMLGGFGFNNAALTLITPYEDESDTGPD